MACGVSLGKEQVHRRKILLPSRCVCVVAPDKVIPSEIGFSEGPRGHEAVPGEGPGCHGWM